jgi:hypothetical protein
MLPHGQDLTLASAGEGCSLFLGLEHSVMRPVARTAAEAFAFAAATAATAAATESTSSSSITPATAVSKEVPLFSSSDGQMLLQALLSCSLTVSKACAGLQGWQWYNWPEKPGAETSPLLLANMALLGVQSQLAVSEQLYAQTPSQLVTAHQPWVPRRTSLAGAAVAAAEAVAAAVAAAVAMAPVEAASPSVQHHGSSCWVLLLL